MIDIEKREQKEQEKAKTRQRMPAYRRWFWGITVSFRVPYSNGFTEGKNNKIKVLKRNAFGFRNSDNYKKRILLAA